MPNPARPTKLLAAASLAAALAACQAPGPAGDAGKGGMTAYSIAPQVYAWHDDNGFTGPDAMGWDANLQWAWSRLAAARTCGVPFEQERVVAALIAAYGHDKLAHEMIGIDFHHAQNRKVAGFCTPARLAELQAAVPGMEAGRFPKPFPAAPAAR